MNPCQNCKHSLPGHPRWASHYRSCNHPDVNHLKISRITMGLKYVHEAREEGWFAFPFNYDPRWVKSCKAYETREGEGL